MLVAIVCYRTGIGDLLKLDVIARKLKNQHRPCEIHLFSSGAASEIADACAGIDRHYTQPNTSSIYDLAICVDSDGAGRFLPELTYKEIRGVVVQHGRQLATQPNRAYSSIWDWYCDLANVPYNPHDSEDMFLNVRAAHGNRAQEELWARGAATQGGLIGVSLGTDNQDIQAIGVWRRNYSLKQLSSLVGLCLREFPTDQVCILGRRLDRVWKPAGADCHLICSVCKATVESGYAALEHLLQEGTGGQSGGAHGERLRHHLSSAHLDAGEPMPRRRSRDEPKMPSAFVQCCLEYSRVGATVDDLCRRHPGRVIDGTDVASTALEFAACLSQLKLFIAPECGPAYLACSVRTPTVVVCGNHWDAQAHLPLYDSPLYSAVFPEPDLPCAPCSREFRPPGDILTRNGRVTYPQQACVKQRCPLCMDAVPAERVLGQARALFHRGEGRKERRRHDGQGQYHSARL